MSIENLREELKGSTRDTFKMGDVIRWVAAGKYNYAAIKTPIGWVTTSRGGNSFVDTTYTYEDLLDLLRHSEVSDVEVAVEWSSGEYSG